MKSSFFFPLQTHLSFDAILVKHFKESKVHTNAFNGLYRFQTKKKVQWMKAFWGKLALFKIFMIIFTLTFSHDV